MYLRRDRGCMGPEDKTILGVVHFRMPKFMNTFVDESYDLSLFSNLKQ